MEYRQNTSSIELNVSEDNIEYLENDIIDNNNENRLTGKIKNIVK